MEPSGARTRSSGSGRFSASTRVCGLRFNGGNVAVELGVGVDDGRGVNVSVTGMEVGFGGAAEEEAGATPHPAEIRRHKIKNRLPV